MFYTNQARWELMQQGAQYLLAYLNDSVLDGIGSQPALIAEQLESLSERMVDFKCGSLARRIRMTAEWILKGDGDWTEKVLQLFGKLHIYATKVSRSTLAEMNEHPEWLNWGGWALKKEQLMALPGLKDDWIVMGAVSEKEEQLRVVRTWLWGRHHKRLALHLEYMIGFSRPEKQWVLGKSYHGSLHFYPGAYNIRCLPGDLNDGEFARWPLTQGFSIEQVKAYTLDALSHFPLIEHIPVFVQSVNVRLNDEKQLIVGDSSGQFSKSLVDKTHLWTLLALSANQPVDLIGEISNGAFQVLTVGYRGEFHKVS